MLLPPLHAILDVDAAAAAGWTPLALAAHFFDGGATVVQLRAKKMASGELLELAEALVSRGRPYGAQIIVNDRVDVAVLSNRENNIRAGFSTPLRPSFRLAWEGLTHPRWTIGTFLRTLIIHGMPHFENSYATRGAPILSSRVARDFGAKDHLDWEHLALIRRKWRRTLVVKGIMSHEDARKVRDMGADGLIVSNHGGRQLDGTVSPLRVLPEIVQAVGADFPVMMDGGIRRGTDVLKALALGAKFVFVGRPFGYAAAVAGEQGVRHAIRILADEVQRDLGLLGLTSISEVNGAQLRDLASAAGARR